MIINSLLAITIIALGIVYYLENRKREDFAMCSEQEIDDILDCDLDIPIIPLNCTKIPNFPKGFEPPPDTNKLEGTTFNQLTSKEGKFTFKIPELKYDGIYSKKGCNWTLSEKCQKTYGSDNLLHIPKKCLIGKTIIQPTECYSIPTGYPPEVYANEC